MTLRRSLFAAVVGRYAIFALQIGLSMVLARLLTPAEMGVWGVAQSAIFLSSTLRDFGAGDYLVRSGDIGPKSIGRVFAVMLSISLVCAALLWLFRNAIALFFKRPEIAGLLEIMTLTYLLMPFGLGALVVLEREYAFVKLQWMQAAATISGGATAIVLALHGFSFYSLAWAQLVQMAVLLALRAIVKPAAVFCRPIFSGWSGIFQFGLYTTLTGISSQISGQAITGAIGRLLGMESLGYYERANGISGYVGNDLTFAIMQVVYVGFSKAKDKSEEAGALFLLTLENFTGVMWPGYVLVALLSGPLLLLFYGPQWTAAAPLLSILCLGATIQAAYVPHVRMLTSLSRVKTIFLIEATATALRVAAVLLLARRGLAWVSLGVVLPSLPVAIFYWRALHRRLTLAKSRLVAVLLRSLAVTFCATLPVVVLLRLPAIAAAGPAIQLAATLSSAALGWLLGLFLSGHRLKNEVLIALKQLPHLLRRLRSRWSRPGFAPPAVENRVEDLSPGAT